MFHTLVLVFHCALFVSGCVIYFFCLYGMLCGCIYKFGSIFCFGVLKRFPLALSRDTKIAVGCIATCPVLAGITVILKDTAAGRMLAYMELEPGSTCLPNHKASLLPTSPAAESHIKVCLLPPYLLCHVSAPNFYKSLGSGLLHQSSECFETAEHRKKGKSE